MPPPTAVIIPRVTTPTMSTCTARTAVSAPFTANANVPTRSNTNSAGITVSTARVYSIAPQPEPAEQVPSSALRSGPFVLVGATGIEPVLRPGCHRPPTGTGAD